MSVRADCCSAEPRVEAPDSAGFVAEVEEGEFGLHELFGDFPHPAGYLGGSIHAELLHGSGAVDLGTQSWPQPGSSSSRLGITAKSLEISTPAECTGGRERLPCHITIWQVMA